ncbi:MAG: hypothetical protein P1U35_14075 [Cycloclasticus sp.]|nr:hypothetical protein [Cycloclasticus sp.]
MKSYGIPRNMDVERPDLADIRTYGFKSSISRVQSKSGDRKNSFRKSAAKRATRRIWKKKARIAGKQQARTET